MNWTNGQQSSMLCSHLDWLNGAPFTAVWSQHGREQSGPCRPVVRLALAFGAGQAKLPLQLLDDAVLRTALVHDDGAQPAALGPLAVHGVHIGGLLGASDDRLQLKKVTVRPVVTHRVGGRGIRHASLLVVVKRSKVARSHTPRW